MHVSGDYRCGDNRAHSHVDLVIPKGCAIASSSRSIHLSFIFGIAVIEKCIEIIEIIRRWWSNVGGVLMK
jgi:hypothetical protein